MSSVGGQNHTYLDTLGTDYFIRRRDPVNKQLNAHRPKAIKQYRRDLADMAEMNCHTVTSVYPVTNRSSLSFSLRARGGGFVYQGFHGSSRCNRSGL